MEIRSGFRLEQDALGTLEVPVSAYYGVHTLRALENFAVSGRRVNPHLIRAMVTVKKAAALAHLKLNSYPPEIAIAIVQACDEIHAGGLAGQFVVDALQGGAGTSTNMNVNEVVANRAVELLGGVRGDYTVVHPLDHVNCCQSTNDVYPTALRIAAIGLLRKLSDACASLQEALQEKELKYAEVLKLGRTELMDALPVTAGQSFGAYARAVQRDRWRLYKAEERLREINIGGTAVGTGMNAPVKYTFYMTELLQELTGFGLARSDFPMDGTQNMDVFTEVSGLLKAAAVNLLKISGDLRLLASGPAGGLGELKLPPVQAGSSIMPGKVNPVMAEMLGTAAMRVIANDTAVTMASGSGQLELNAFLPLIADALLDSLELLQRAVTHFTERCVRGIIVNGDRCTELLERSGVYAAAFISHIGYDKSAEAATRAMEEGKTIRQVLLDSGLLPGEKVEQILNPNQLTKPGIPGKGRDQ